MYKVLLTLTALAALPSEAFLFRSKCDLTRPREQFTSKSFDHCKQAALDAFYEDLELPRMIPDGSYNGRVQIAGNGVWNFVPSIIREPKEYFLERLWKGKVFYREDANNAVLFNRILSKTLMFPAHVFYGKSLYDSKLSVIIDYSHNADIEGYRSSIDWVVAEKGLAIRDEIRQVNDSLFLGRAYVRGKFLLNFVLERAAQ
jgi:hypothetical protein